MKIQTTRGRLLASTMICGAMALALAGPAFAQEELPVPTDAGPTEVEGIVVTGSRIIRQDYVANSPIATVTGEQAVANADITLETYLNTLPQVNAGGTTTSNNPPNGGQANIDLRGLGPNRNLVLVDGRRPMVSANDLTVDVNTIPQALIENIEIITGGAGAAYGADAIAGVVNVRLKRNFEGVEISTSYSNSTEYWDAEEYQISGAIGGNFADGKGNAVLGFDRSYRQPMIKSQRPFSVLATSTTGTPPEGVIRFASSNEIPEAAVDALFATYGVAADQVAAQSGRLGFNQDGTLFYAGVYNSPLDVQNFTDPVDESVNTRFFPDFYSYNFDAVNLLVLPMDRYSFMFNTRYEMDSGWEVFGGAAWTEYRAASALAPTPVPSVDTANPADCDADMVCSTLVEAGGEAVSGALVVPVTNPFIPADLLQLLNARTGDDPDLVGAGADEPFRFSVRPVAFGLRLEEFTNTVVQFHAGVRGPISDTWDFEAYVSEGRTRITDTQSGNIDTQGLTDVLADPATAVGGACATWNPFGANPLPSECRDALAVTTGTELNMTQQIAQAFVRGDVVTLPAGTVAAVLGAEYRTFEYDFDPGTSAGPISGFNTALPEGGTNAFYDLFTEVLVPVARDQPYIQNLELNFGARYSWAEFTDTITGVRRGPTGSPAYKIELNWQPIDIARLRASWQRAVRAPNFGELFQGGGSFPQIFDPCSITSAARTGPNGDEVRQLCLDAGLIGGVPASDIDRFVATPGSQAIIGTSGNTDLRPEKGTTYTVGLVVNSPWEGPWARLRGSIDYYKIEVEDAILAPDVNMGIAGCFNYHGTNPDYSPDNLYCQGLYRSGDILAVFNPNDPDYNFAGLNGGRIETSGIDFQIDYGFDMPADLGVVSLNLLVTHLLEYDIQDTPGLPSIDYAGTVNYFGGGISLGQTFPEWRLTGSANWRTGPFGLSVRGRYIGDMINRASLQFPGEEFEGVPAMWYWDAAGSYQVNDNVEVRLGVNNLFNEEPPLYSPNVQSGTDPATYDVIGRRLFGQLRLRF